MSFLVDTDVCSAFLKGDGRVFNRFVQHSGGIAVSALTVGELTTWASRRAAPSARIMGLRELLSSVTIHLVDEAVATTFGKVRAEMLDRGQPRPSVDLFIASTALTHDLTLVTHNGADYVGVPGLRIVDWLA